MKSSPRATIRFALVLLLWHAGFYALTLHYGVLYMGDSWEYVTAGYNILEHGTLYSGSQSLPVAEEYMTQRTPLYPVALAAVYAAGGTNWMAILLQGLMSVSSLLVLRSTLLRIGYNPRYDWLLLLLLLTFPPQYIHAMWVEPEALLQLFTVLYFRSWVLLVRGKCARHAWAMSGWLVLGLLTKPVLYPFAAVHAIVMAAAAFRWKLSKGIFVAALIPLLVVVGYRQVNKTRTGLAHFSSNGAFNALYYAYPFYQHRWGTDSAATWLDAQRAAVQKFPRFADRYAEAERRGAIFLRQHWLHYFPFHATGSARLLLDPGKADIDLFTGRLTYGKLYGIRHPGVTAQLPGITHSVGQNRIVQPSFLLALAVLVFNIARVAGFGLFLTDVRQSPAVRIALLFLIVYFAWLAGPIAVPRYLLPVWPLMAGAAALGWSRILARRFSARCFSARRKNSFVADTPAA